MYSFNPAFRSCLIRASISSLAIACSGLDLAVRAETVVVPLPSPYSYEQTSLRQRQVRGSYGRYITFTGHTVIEWPANPAQFNPGNPGRIQCQSNQCWLQGYVAPTLVGSTPAGSLRSFFSYQLDCLDRTFDRVGDGKLPGKYARGWQPVTNDPTALAVADSWCPRILELPQ